MNLPLHPFQKGIIGIYGMIFSYCAIIQKDFVIQMLCCKNAQLKAKNYEKALSVCTFEA